MFTALPAIAVLAALGALVAISHRSASSADRRAESAEVARAAALNARGYLDDQFAILASVAANADVAAGSPKMLPYLRRVIATGRFENGIGFIDTRGFTRLSTSLPPGTPPIDLSDRRYVRRALSGQAAVSEVVLGRVRNRPLLTYAFPTRDAKNMVSGVVAGSLALDAAGEGLRRLLFSPDAGVTLVDSAGHVIVGSAPVRGLQAPPRGYPVARMRRERHGVVDSAQTAQGRRVLGFATVGGTGWTAVVDRPYSAVIGPLNRTLWAEIGALALFALVGVLLTFAVGRRLDRLDRAREDALSEQREIALALQRSLLPDLEVPEGLSASAFYVPAQGVVAVGGDWYDLIDGGDGRVALNVGDVAGHGLDAAATMGKLRSAARVEGLRPSAPRDALTALDRFAGSLALRPLATVAYVVLDLRTGRMRYALAGHPPPLLIRADGTTSYLEGGRSPLLGVPPLERRAEGEATLRPGDTLVIYTDGLVERPESSIDEGLATLAERAATLVHDVPALAEQLVSYVPEPRRDDAAVLAVQYLGVRQPSSVAS